MSARRARAWTLAATIAVSASIAACGGDATNRKDGPSTFLDVYVSPDASCDAQLPFCVSSVTVNLTPVGAPLHETCHEVAAALGYPASTVDELSVLAGAAIAEGLPSSGIVGIELRAYSEACASVPGTTATPVLSGLAQIELLDEDQQLYLPIRCAQPILPCSGSEPTL